MKKNKKYIVVDLDDTIARKTTRHHYQWERVYEDAPIQETISLIDRYDNIIILTARNEGYPHPLKKKPELRNYNTCGREATEKWVEEHVGDVHMIIMKPAGSYETSSVFKATEIQKLLNDGYEIDFVLDDNESVCEALNEIGITTLRVTAK